jgi:type IV secretion system protein VirB3
VDQLMLGRTTVNFDLAWQTRSFLRKVASNATRAAQQRARTASASTEEAMLFVSDTRPALFAGLPHILAVSLIILFGESIVFVGPLWAFWVIAPYFLVRSLVKRDYNAPRVALLWAQSKMRSLDAHIWRGASPSPFPERPGKWPRGIPDVR